ncbi:hypothetical protein OSB04_025201 [Centaurea solstitialis]|uniref:Uncharacterized protein n=1 Tax=Centaurea solstitialis TaxID=347529 RepID=A0AA38WCV4_9ASTR|nr:hypothetical protein OSB04_025201 [Centaurea solstitialis]
MICVHACSLQSNMTTMKHIFRYIKGTLEHGLHFSTSPTTSLVAYSDANWDGFLDTRCSTSSSKRQLTLFHFSAKADYPDVANVVAEISWVALGQFHVLHVPSSSQYVDIFTKGLPSSSFLGFLVQSQRSHSFRFDYRSVIRYRKVGLVLDRLAIISYSKDKTIPRLMENAFQVGEKEND